MSWRDRLRAGAITTPNGQRFSYDYEDLEKEVQKKTNIYTFGSTPGALVQDFGLGVTTYPLRIIFNGDNYDRTANSFETGAGFKGVSLLEHPIYGIKNVNITGYRRLDRLKTAANQAIFEVELVETIIPAVPTSAEALKSTIIGDLNDLQDIQGQAFDAVNYDNVSDLLAARERITQFVKDFSGGFENITNQVQGISDASDNTVNFITDNIDELLEDPPNLAASVYNLARIPARSTAAISSRVSAYIDTLANQVGEIAGLFGADLLNARTEAQLNTTAALAGLAGSTLFPDDTLLTRPAATDIVDDLLTAYRAVQNFLDTEQFNSLDESLTNTYSVNDALNQGIKDIISKTAGNLLQLAFSLKQERIIFLDNETNMIPLCFKLYGGKIEDEIVEGTGKSKLDFLIETNELTGAELITIPKGREIRYYV